jgi:hypothetical protein
VAAWIDGKLRTTDHLETAAKLRTDTIAPFAGIVRVEGIGLIVDGELRTDTIRARDENGTTSVSKLAVTGSLTVGGQSVVGGSPIFCGGRVNGATATQVSSIGKVGYTVSRPSGQATGIWTITFNSPAANNGYTVQLTNMNFGTSYLWDQMPPTVQGFTLVIVGFTSTGTTLRDATFHFTVFG